MRRRVSGTVVPVAAPIVLALAAILSSDGYQQTASDASVIPPCAKAHAAARDALHETSALHTRVVRNRIDSGVMLFRAGRSKESGASLDFALALLDRTRKRLMSFEERDRVHQAVDELRRCVDTSVAPAMATLTVRTYEQDDRVADGRGGPAEPGALVRVDEMPIGRTGPGGIFTGTVPSGSVRVTAEIPPSEWGEQSVSLSPGGANAVSIVLHSDKEVFEETPLVVAEADAGLLPAASPSLTLKFLTPEGTVRIERISEIEIVDADGRLVEDVTRMFSILAGDIVAVDAAKVIRLLQARSDGRVVLRVNAVDDTKDGIIHASEVEFLIQ